MNDNIKTLLEAKSEQVQRAGRFFDIVDQNKLPTLSPANTALVAIATERGSLSEELEKRAASLEKEAREARKQASLEADRALTMLLMVYDDNKALIDKHIADLDEAARLEREYEEERARRLAEEDAVAHEERDDFHVGASFDESFDHSEDGEV